MTFPLNPNLPALDAWLEAATLPILPVAIGPDADEVAEQLVEAS